MNHGLCISFLMPQIPLETRLQNSIYGNSKSCNRLTKRGNRLLEATASFLNTFPSGNQLSKMCNRLHEASASKNLIRWHFS